MDSLKQWQAHRNIYMPKKSAKKEIDAFSSLPDIPRIAPVGELGPSIKTWLTTLRLRGLITTRFGAPRLHDSMSVERVLETAMGQIGTIGNPANPTEPQLQICGDVTRKQLNAMVEAQLGVERSTTGNIKEVVEVANNLSHFLSSGEYCKWAKRVEEVLGVVDSLDEIMFRTLKDSEEYERAYEQKMHMQYDAYYFFLHYRQVDKHDKEITALLAEVGVHVARQKVLWDYDRIFKRARAATKAHERFTGGMLGKRKAANAAREKGERVPGKWYETKTQDLITEYGIREARRDSKIKVIERKVAKLKVSSVKEARPMHQMKLEAYMWTWGSVISLKRLRRWETEKWLLEQREN